MHKTQRPHHRSLSTLSWQQKAQLSAVTNIKQKVAAMEEILSSAPHYVLYLSAHAGNKMLKWIANCFKNVRVSDRVL